MGSPEQKNALARAVRAVCLSNAPAKVQHTFRILSQVLKEITKYPDDPRRRRFDTASPHYQMHIGQVSGVEKILSALGYAPEEGQPDGIIALPVPKGKAVVATAEGEQEWLGFAIEMLEEAMNGKVPPPTPGPKAERKQEQEQHQQQQQQQQQQQAQSQSLPASIPGAMEELVKQLMELGFSQQRAVDALLMFDNNLERAVNYLLSEQKDSSSSSSELPFGARSSGGGSGKERKGEGDPAPFVPRPQSEDIESVLARLEAEEEARREEERKRAEEESKRMIEQLQKEEEERISRLKATELQDKESVKAMLREEMKAGRQLTQQQINFLFAPAEWKEGEELECPVCYAPYPLDKVVVLEECSHFLCSACMYQYFNTQINDGRSKDMKCPDPQCYRLITLPEVRRVVDRKLFDKYETFLLEAHLKLDPNCRWCSRPGCGTPMIGHPSVPMMRCPRDGCGFTYCYNCKEAWHADITCEQYQKWKEENANAENRFEEWRKKNTKSCPSCKGTSSVLIGSLLFLSLCRRRRGFSM